MWSWCNNAACCDPRRDAWGDCRGFYCSPLPHWLSLSRCWWAACVWLCRIWINGVRHCWAKLKRRPGCRSPLRKSRPAGRILARRLTFAISKLVWMTAANSLSNAPPWRWTFGKVCCTCVGSSASWPSGSCKFTPTRRCRKTIAAMAWRAIVSAISSCVSSITSPYAIAISASWPSPASVPNWRCRSWRGSTMTTVTVPKASWAFPAWPGSTGWWKCAWICVMKTAC